MDLHKKLEKYIIDHSNTEDEILNELDRETHLNVLGARMLSGNLQGQFLTMISKMVQPKTILEIGTFTGYSAICLAKGLQKNGKLITIEIDDELERIATKYFEKAGIQNVVEQHFGSAIEIIPQLNEQFDLIFIDADKREYSAYYNLVFDKVKAGGYILVDNTLWNGKVLNKPQKNDEQTKGVIDFNEMIAADNRIEKLILPLRDGLTIIRKINM
ncbi:MAG: class I SAM-dependent methyltransferase [Prolixibacteraceae bacterium]|nr:class I SAM-dependent methyltransferase [Prolixibacteraceae bacterium]